MNKIEVYDDLKSNFRAWEINGCESEEELQELISILELRHPACPIKELYNIVIDWTGYQPKRKFEFVSKTIIEAKDEEEARELFANTSWDFAANAECNEIE